MESASPRFEGYGVHGPKLSKWSHHIRGLTSNDGDRKKHESEVEGMEGEMLGVSESGRSRCDLISVFGVKHPSE